MMSELKLVSMATERVCPNTHLATTRYEKEMVRILVKFGRAVLEADRSPMPKKDDPEEKK